MSPSRRWLLVLVALVATGLGLLWWAEFYTEWLWYRSDAYPVVFTRRMVTSVLAFVLSAPLLWLLLWTQLRRANRSGVPLTRLDPDDPDLRGVVEGFVPLVVRWVPLLGAAAGGLALAQGWQLWLLVLHGQPFGVVDPQFGHDVGFYVYRLGAAQQLLKGLSAALLVLVALCAVLYAQRRQIRVVDQELVLGDRARGHLLVLVGCLLVVRAGLLWLRRYQLLLNLGGLFPGAGWADVHVKLPGLALAAATALVAALVCVSWRRTRPALWAFGVHFALFVLGVGLAPALAQRLVVRPNESVREQPYLARAIAATRRAFALDQVEVLPAPSQGTPTAADLARQAETVDNIRVWDHRPLLRTLKQLQEIRQYYDVVDVDSDRYVLGGVPRQVLVAARELNHAQLDEQARTWLNQHVEYTHGLGLVMALAGRADAQGQPHFAAGNIPPVGAPELALREPRLYFGEVILLPPDDGPARAPVLPGQTSAQPTATPDEVAERHRRRLNDVAEPDVLDYVLVGTTRDEFDYAETVGGQEVKHRTRYAGRSGVPLGGFARRVLWGLRFRSPELVFTRLSTPQTRLLLHRQITRRCKLAAPFLVWDTQPYPAVVDGRVVWICEGYTMSQSYPCSALHYEPQVTPRGWVMTPTWNYLRNPVKAVVDAYHGTLDFYLVDEGDPLARTFARIYPGVLQPASAAPAALRAHFRYPQLLFRAQADMYQRYHMTDPAQFYAGEDLWATARELDRSVAAQALRRRARNAPNLYRPMDPYYIQMSLPGEPRAQFMLLRAFTPYGAGGRGQRDNLVGLLMGLCDPGRYGELVAYAFPKDRTVYGPLQVEALIDQDEAVSQQLTLWDKGGSQVIRGHLLVVPLVGSLLYVQPLYLEAANKGLPELKRVVVVHGQRVVMEPTLGAALSRLFGRAPVLAPPPPLSASGPSRPGPGALAEAQAAFEASEAALRAGDWARVARERERLRAALSRLATP